VVRGSRHVACSTGDVRVQLTLAFALLASLTPRVATAQLTLVIRDQPDAHPAVETAVEDALRESVGGSFRRLESPLDDLALAAGCEPGGATEAECIASLARAGDARLVAIEHLRRDGAEWSVRIDLRRADGTHLSTLVARCDDASCAPQPAASRPEAPTVAASTPAPSEPEPPPTLAASTPSPEHAPRSLAIVPHVLFFGAVLFGIGSFVAGAVSLSSANEATSLGALHTTAQLDEVHAAEEQRDVSLGVGIALAVCGAGLAVAGAITVADDGGPRLRIGLSGAQLSVSF
jgi:cell division septation protein DedD